MDRQKLGRAGEEYAAKYLRKLGCIILERNFRCRYGEIDIIALDHGILCFIEVKTRSSLDFGMPCQAVDSRKERRIRRCAYVYMSRYQMEDQEIRVDIIEVLFLHQRFYIRRLINGRKG